jgi:membrane-bound lytic murein transglycosylase MltF
MPFKENSVKHWMSGVLLLSLVTSVAAQQPPGKPPQAARAELPLDLQTFTGDYDAMLKRRVIRVGVAYNRTHYFIDRGVQHGFAYEGMKLFEDQINATIKRPIDKVHLAFFPMSRDEMLNALLEGRVDLLAANLTITPERRKLGDFSDPIRKDVSEIVVTGPGAPPIKTKADLAGQEVFVRQNSTYHEHLIELNGQLKVQGLPAVKLKLAPQNLEDDDILEMVNAGLAKITVVDNFLAEFWVQIFTNLTMHKDVALTVNGEIALGMRPNSPQLKAAINAFIKKNGQGTLYGNMLLKRYLANTKFVKSAASEADMQRFQTMVGFFRKYSEKYSLDYLLVAAQGYQESGLNQSVKSPVGAIGVMQVMPATGKELAVMIDQYFKGEPMDDLNKGLMAFASYNAGPNRIRQLRAETKKRGLNENIWFNNVEQIVSERIGRETVTYVSNIYKYYIAYRLTMEQLEERKKAVGQ